MAETQDKVIYEGNSFCCGAFCQWFHKTRWKITTRSIERESGICMRDVENIELMRVQDISFRTCMCCSRCATIVIISNDQTEPEMMIKGIPNAREVYKQLKESIQAIHKSARLEFQQ